MQLVYLDQDIDSAPVFDQIESDCTIYSGGSESFILLAKSLKSVVDSVCMVSNHNERYLTAYRLKHEDMLSPIYVVTPKKSFHTWRLSEEGEMTLQERDIVPVLGDL